MTHADTMDVELLVLNAGELVTLSRGSLPRKGAEMNELSIIEDGGIAVNDGVIVDIGRSSDIRANYTSNIMIDAGGDCVLPGFVDPHTHLIYAGSRENELALKLEGKTYLEILAQGGGILRTMKATRGASDDVLIDETVGRMDRMLEFGTTTAEAKTGYALDPEGELRLLRLLKRIDREHPLDLVTTYLGAHVVPPEYKDRSDDYIDALIGTFDVIEQEQLASFCDVFCEKGVFTAEQGKRLLEAAADHGMRPKAHIDEIETIGGADMAADIRAVSAEHLLASTDDGIRSLAEAGTVGVLLPGTSFTLMKGYANARKMIESGLPIALATDLNPNCWTESMQFIIALACMNMRMTPAEALAAATINAAFAIGEQEHVGSLEVGKRADILVLDAPNHVHIPYHVGVNLVRTVIKGGRIVVHQGRRTQ